ncbi:MAG: LysR family transcriptional regulator [Cyanobacteriota bacterium]
MSSNIKLAQLRALVAVANHGNFSEAALHLNLSQSAISHSIASLEEELGIPLLIRGRNGALPTPTGERVLDHARQILKLLEAIEQEALRERGLQGGKLRIGSFRSAATHLLPPILSRFRNRFPNIEITILEHDEYAGVEEDLREGRVDLGFTHLPCGSEFETFEILRDEYVALLPPHHILGDGPLTWDQLAQLPLILSADNSGCCGLALENHLRRAGQSFRYAYEVREDSTVVSMVAQGLGAAILPRLAAEPVPVGVQIRSLPDPLERVIGVALRANGLHTPAVYAFLDAIRGTGLFATVSVA